VPRAGEVARSYPPNYVAVLPLGRRRSFASRRREVNRKMRPRDSAKPMRCRARSDRSNFFGVGTVPGPLAQHRASGSCVNGKMRPRCNAIRSRRERCWSSPSGGPSWVAPIRMHLWRDGSARKGKRKRPRAPQGGKRGGPGCWWPKPTPSRRTKRNRSDANLSTEIVCDPGRSAKP
jgi:hypothetical protein